MIITDKPTAQAMLQTVGARHVLEFQVERSNGVIANCNLLVTPQGGYWLETEHGPDYSLQTAAVSFPFGGTPMEIMQ